MSLWWSGRLVGRLARYSVLYLSGI